ncbi:MAG: hypothetical protein LW630_10750 [Saprospiraceae bacterium]|nr:hypothetical protein [Saprospiraceae bacterium]
MNRNHLFFLMCSFFLSWTCAGQTGISANTSLPFDRFWNDMISDFHEEFLRVDSAGFAGLCVKHGVSPDDAGNQKKYATLGLLHRMMTSSSPANCSMEGALQIPYYWHWGNSRPRNEIVWTETGQTLLQVRPPAGFNRYQCLADIDRTPILFWKDLLTLKPRYFTPDCDSFYTFGWCSEREMAYQAFLRAINFLPSQESQSFARIIVEGAHSWSEVAVKLNTVSGQEAWFLVSVDNTYGTIKWTPADAGGIAALRSRQGLTKEDRWYNQQAKAALKIQTLQSLQVSVPVQRRIHRQLAAFFVQN